MQLARCDSKSCQTQSVDRQSHFSNKHLYSALKLNLLVGRPHEDPKTGGGTGFIARTPQGKHYLLTNRHLLDPQFSKPLPPEYRILRLTISGHADGTTRGQETGTIHHSIDVSGIDPVFLDDYALDIAVLPLTDLATALPAFNTLDSNTFLTRADFATARLPAGWPVQMAGYPGASEHTAVRPLLVSGTIASDPRYPAAYDLENYPTEVLCHSFSKAGMSGAPVLAILPTRDFMTDEVVDEVVVAGINTGHLRLANEPSVLSRFVPAPLLREALVVAGASELSNSVELERLMAEDGPFGPGNPAP